MNFDVSPLFPNAPSPIGPVKAFRLSRANCHHLCVHAAAVTNTPALHSSRGSSEGLVLPSVCLLYVVCQLNRRKRRSGNDPKSLAWWFCPFFFNYFINPHIADFSLLFFFMVCFTPMCCSCSWLNVAGCPKINSQGSTSPCRREAERSLHWGLASVRQEGLTAIFLFCIADPM